jgi:hypothetical protein
MLGVFAEFEKGMIVERVHAGIARARANGKRFGRPAVKQKVADAVQFARSGSQHSQVRCVTGGLDIERAADQGSCAGDRDDLLRAGRQVGIRQKDRISRGG